ncbi:MAG: aminoglycoside phosphotransferase family protein [Planctomycetota bacterium]|nr:aminoglycoside phosphotransferase family protein [Planctomycetota bacterium]
MSKPTSADALQMAENFSADGTPQNAEIWSGGHINTSFRITFSENTPPRRYLLQRINAHVFPQGNLIMENIRRVTLHVFGMLQSTGVQNMERHFLSLVPTKQGGFCVQDADGHFWRMYPWVEGTQTKLQVETTGQANSAAFAFGDFLRLTADLTHPPLHTILPDFHHTPKRLQALQEAVQSNPKNRLDSAADALALVEELTPDACILQTLLDQKQLPWRPVHNDTKISNVLFDATNQEALCVVDLDTVMPGSALHDFGDMARSMATRTPEDGRNENGDWVEAKVDTELFAAVCHGFLQGAGDSLAALEKQHLLLSAQALATELGARFLMDYLLGDTYFGITRPQQNLERAQTQLGIAKEFLQRKEELEKVAFMG